MLAPELRKHKRRTQTWRSKKSLFSFFFLENFFDYSFRERSTHRPGNSKKMESAGLPKRAHTHN